MKKSLLALAVLASASAAQAATVYDKDGTSLVIGGRIQAVAYNGNARPLKSNSDASLVNSSRLNISGRTQVNDCLSVFAFSEWNMADGNNTNYSRGENLNTREQYVGADFNKYGQLLLGKTYDAVYAVQAATDVYEDFGVRVQGYTDGERRPGQIRYIYDNNGIFASFGYQTAQDNVSVNSKNINIRNGFSSSLGYTFDDVFGEPLSFKAGYSYIQAQEDNNEAMDNFKNIAASVAWGGDTGLYLAFLYETTRDKKRADGSNSSDCNKTKGYEFVVGYGFENGLTINTGYQLVDLKVKHGSVNENSYIYRRIPVYANYSLNSNFNVWAEAEFDADSTNRSSDKKEQYGFETGTLLSVGARYTF